MFRKAPKGIDAIITGPPRSGTTLSCQLLNKAENTVALDEPMRIIDLHGLSHKRLIRAITSFFYENRKTLLKEGKAQSKSVGGEIKEHTLDTKDDDGLRVLFDSIESTGQIQLNKPLNDEFTLLLKHPAAFTALLPLLKQHFPVYAIVRNPLATLASWNSINMPVRNGYAPAAQRFSPQLTHLLDAEDERLQRQVILLDWFFRQYAKHLNQYEVVRYEDIVASKGTALQVLSSSAAFLDESLEDRNQNPLYNQELVIELRARLFAFNGAWLNYYREEDINARA